MRHFSPFSSFILISSAGVFLASCLAVVSPVPTPTRVKDVDGRSMPKHLGIRSIKPGSTRRHEVLQKIGWADAGLQSKRLSLARWKVSHMAVCWAAAAEGGDGDAGCRSVWKARNLMVEFDGQGIVRKVRRSPDRDIGKVLAAWLATAPEPPLDLSRPIRILVIKGSHPGKLTLGGDLLAYQENGRRLKSVRVPRQQLLGVETVGWKGRSSYSVRVEIQYKAGRKATRKLKFRILPSSLLTLIEYLEQTHVQRPPMAGILATH